MLLKKPLTIVIAAGCCVMALAVAGINAESKLHQTSSSVGGTESARTTELLRHYFGKSEPFVIVLKGPSKEVKVQGQRLVRSLNRDPLATAISPWSRGAIGQLRPTRRSAVILVSFRVSIDEAVKETVPQLNELLQRRTSPPVRAVQSGFASVSRAIQDEAARATRRGELIAAPLILLVLLLVFRSPVAAAIPLAFGAVTVAASRGILSIAAGWLSIDAFALTASAMMGLALGVDYTLLIVSRFREELATGKSSAAAAQATRSSAGRTIAFAGGVLFASMIASALLLPGTFLVSLAGSVIVVTGFSVVLGVLVVPPVLALVGENINRWSLGKVRKGQSPWFLLASRVLRRPGVVAAVLSVSLMLLALPAISLNVGTSTPEQLPSTNRARINAELVNQEIGPGWAAPFVVLAATSNGSIASRSNLAALRRWERQVASADNVQAVIGPGAIAKRVEPLSRFGHSFLYQDRSGSQADKLQELGSRLGDAAEGVTALRNGIARTTYGAGLLSEGAGNLERGAQAIATALSTAAAGSGKAASSLDRFALGTHEIRRGQYRALLGAQALKYEIQDLIPMLRHSTLFPSTKLQRELTDMQSAIPKLESRAAQADGQLDTALLELQRLPGTAENPHYASAVGAVQAAQRAIAGEASPYATDAGLSDELQSLSSDILHANDRAAKVTSGVTDGLDALAEAKLLSRDLVAGLVRLEGGGRRLASGANQLAGYGSDLAEGLPGLVQGTTALAGGAGRLTTGTSSLVGGLSDAYTLSRPLGPGLRKVSTGSVRGGRHLLRQSRRLRRLSPGIFNSSYFNLAAIDGTPSSLRVRLRQAVDLDNGGQAARILVIPRFEKPAALDSRLRDAAQLLGQRIGGTAGVAGGPAEAYDYSHASSSRLPIVIAVVSLVTFLSLVVILRSVFVPAITVFLNLVSVAVAFGVLALASELPSGAPFGHWAYVDSIGAVAIFAIAFGVSIDYSVFILARMKEEFEQTNDHKAAVWASVHRTGRVITGAAMMMVAVFAAFATSNLAIVSQLGVGLTVAILLDATVIRLVLLPALLLVTGERCWWFPASFGRALGHLRHS